MISDLLVRLIPSQRIKFLEKVPGVTPGGGGFSYNDIVILNEFVLHLMGKYVK